MLPLVLFKSSVVSIAGLAMGCMTPLTDFAGWGWTLLLVLLHRGATEILVVPDQFSDWLGA